MWLFTVRGFFSVVIDNQHEGRMLIRARCRADIFNLYNDHHEALSSMTRPASDPTRDYRWRLSVSREEWLILATRLADAVNYSNFKSACHKRPDQDSKAGALLHVWGIMSDLQRDENYPQRDDPDSTTIDEPDKPAKHKARKAKQ